MPFEVPSTVAPREVKATVADPDPPPAAEHSASLHAQVVAAPHRHDPTRAQMAMADLQQAAGEIADGAVLLARLQAPPVRDLLLGIFGASPYLTGLILRDPARLLRTLDGVPGERLARLEANLAESLADATTIPAAMGPLRAYKTEVALLIALADIGGVWPVMTVTQALTRAADTALQHAIRFLFARATKAGDLAPADPALPERDSGYIVLGMGKYGAGELNYSSDIDLVTFFERGKASLREGLEPQAFFVRLTRDLVRLMQERTAEGYVFRIDLRLRPDPGATQVVLSTAAAMHYYETVGQNWERAALIKARAVAGDIGEGEALLSELAPYVWRKYLDYAAIADIHAMKRQIHAFKGFSRIAVAGHNIKLGRGGIREIEFFAQTQQLIAGGRQKDLRTARTLEALQRLQARSWISLAVVADLTAAYHFLRMVEHRLQMIADEQTQTLPSEPDKLELVAHFCGFADTSSFSAKLTGHLEAVQRHYAALFETSDELTAGGGSLVFTGDEHDPETVETLARMGYGDPNSVMDMVKGWHFGRYPAMRSARARERLTEFQPVLLETLAKTPEPNVTLAAFDRFLSELPGSVQLFSLLRSNPGLLQLIAGIMGTAPRLARILSRRARLLDAVLDPGFFGREQTREALAEQVDGALEGLRDYQDVLDGCRVVGNEQAFLIGVRVLSGTISARRAGRLYAMLAEALIGRLHTAAEQEIAAVHGRMRGGASAVIAMGKLGGEEMAPNSDLDLIVLYDYEEDAPQSVGGKPLPGPQYYSRLTQKLVSAITSPTAEGRLYEVDMRLRPSGNKGPVASRLDGFIEYQNEAAWTWEHMALTRARVITGSPPLRHAIEAAIGAVLTRPRDAAKLAADVRDMRQRIEGEKKAKSPWDLKQSRGGIVDLEFIAQFLQLKHAHKHPEVLHQNTQSALWKLHEAGVLSRERVDGLLQAALLYVALSQIQRLCMEGPFDPDKAPAGLKQLLARAADMPDFSRLEGVLVETEASVAALYEQIVQ